MTRTLMLSTHLVACACSHGPVRSDSPIPTSTSETIRSLLVLEQALFRAIQARDRAALTELLAEDFVFRGPGDVEREGRWRVVLAHSVPSVPEVSP